MASLTLSDATPENCTRSQCGAIPAADRSAEFLIACNQSGYAGTRNCSDDVCKPYIPEIRVGGWGQALDPPCRQSTPTPSAPPPSIVNTVMPSITATANTAPTPQPTVSLTYLQQRMPSIVNPTPVDVAVSKCDSFSSWVDANPLIAAGVLGALAYFFIYKR